jgi:hypothetical protein
MFDFKVHNDGEKILACNYWDSELERRGLFFLTTNAGVYRLLIPRNQEDWLYEIATAKMVVISYGLNANTGKEGFEIMFDDQTDNPFCLHLDERQADRVSLPSDQGWGKKFAIYLHDQTEPAVVCQPVYFRRVATIPCLLPAGKEGKSA